MLGRELASALAAEERRRAGKPPPSPLAGIRYEPESTSSWRWTDARQDAAVAAFAAGYGDLDPDDRIRVRTSLSLDDCYTLVMFARRCALAAIRIGDATRVTAAFDALAAITLERVDWRDVWVTAGLTAYAGQRLGIDVGAVAGTTAELAEPDVAEVFAEVTQRPIDSIDACGYREVQTLDGPVFFNDEGEEFAPEADLLSISRVVAATLERDIYRVADITAGADLPDVWLGGSPETGWDAADATRRLTGCVAVHAAPRTDAVNDTSAHFMLAFLAESTTSEDAALIATAAQRHPLVGAAQLGVAVGRLCVVLVARAAVLDAPSIEDATSLGRFRAGLTAAIS